LAIARAFLFASVESLLSKVSMQKARGRRSLQG